MSMEFCEKCGSMLGPKKIEGKIVIICPKCGIGGKELTKEKQMMKEEIKHSDKEKTVIIENPDEMKLMPRKKMYCTKCKKNVDTEYWAVQTRAGDEATTRFFRCTICKQTWREYE